MSELNFKIHYMVNTIAYLLVSDIAFWLLNCRRRMIAPLRKSADRLGVSIRNEPNSAQSADDHSKGVTEKLKFWSRDGNGLETLIAL